MQEHEDMNWPQVFDGRGWSSAVGRLYGVDAIPFTLLLDKTGKIRHKDLRGADLGQAVEAILNEKPE